MEKIIVYHGSNVEVAEPRILQNGFYKDFGYGFYCTKYDKQAKRKERRWVITSPYPTSPRCSAIATVVAWQATMVSCFL